MDKKMSPEELFASGLACSQIVLGAYAEKFELDASLARKISAGFAAGMQISGTCGAVTGAIMVLGLHGCEEDCATSKERRNVYELTKVFIEAFKEKNSSLNCRELLGCDISTKSGLEKAQENKLFQTKCPLLVKNSLQILDSLIDKS